MILYYGRLHKRHCHFIQICLQYYASDAVAIAARQMQNDKNVFLKREVCITAE